MPRPQKNGTSGLTLITPEYLAEERLKQFIEHCEDHNFDEDNSSLIERVEPVAKPTKNLTAPICLRLRHDQRTQLAEMINSMTDKELSDLAMEDRLKFKDAKSTMNRGKPANPSVVIIRLALDEYLKKQAMSLDSLPLFRGLEDE